MEYHTFCINMRCPFLQAIDYLLQGKAVAFPTDTVYGLGVSLHAQRNGEVLFNLKQRARNKPLVVYVNSVQDIEKITHNSISEVVQLLSKTFLPGPMTLIVHNNNKLFGEKLGFRIVQHPIVRALIDYTGPLLATSANASTFPSALFASDVQEDFNDCDELLYIFSGSCTLGLESTVIDTDPIRIYREGVICQQEIEVCLNQKVLVTPQKKQYPNLNIYTVKDKHDLTCLLNQFNFNKTLIEYKPTSFRFYPILRQALRTQVQNVIFVYDKRDSSCAILRPFLSPYLMKFL